jgi:hypothetical protein
MDAAEVVVDEMQCHGIGVRLEFLAERVREPCEPAHVHSRSQVLALYE